MSIKYFPDRVFKKNSAAIDRVMAKREIKVIRGSANVTSSALNAYISSNSDWQINSIQFTFSSATPRNYTAYISNGIKIVKGLNDSLWFQTNTPATLWQKIVLTPGFYSGTELATELENQLNANTVYTDESITFTVAYDAVTGLFTITPSASTTIKYFDKNITQRLPERDSLGGHLFGLTSANNTFGSTIVSLEPQFGLNEESWVIDHNGSTVTTHYNDDVHVLSLDQALHLASNTAGVVINWEVAYEEIV